MLVLDSGGLSRLCERSTSALALVAVLRREGLWPPVVPSVVLAESLTGDGRRDARANQFLKACDVLQDVPVRVARRAAFLRAKARRGSAIDAIVVAVGEPDATVLTSDPGDLSALASFAVGVRVERA